MSGVEGESSYVDPAEVMFSSPEYHDYFVAVKDPGSDQVERIGVASVQLAAHSSVFREILSEKKSSELPNSDIVISDVSPAIFKMMLRYVYGGRLPPIDSRDAAELAMCAEAYNVRPLCDKALKMLMPSKAESVFPALITKTFQMSPKLEEEVRKFVEEQTDQVVQDPNFLQIDTSCLLFIVKQEKLNITEVELWRNVVRWAENQVQQKPEKTMRQILRHVLRYIRFLTFSMEEITKHVLPHKILTSDECIDLILAVTGHSSMEQFSLCKITEKRVLHKKEIGEEIKEPQFSARLVFNTFENFTSAEVEFKAHSNFTISPTRTLQLESLYCKTLKNNENNTGSWPAYNFTCLVNISEFNCYNLINKEVIIITVKASFNSKAELSLKKKNGDSLILKENHKYKFGLEFERPHPVHRVCKVINARESQDLTTYGRNLAGMDLQFNDLIHVVNIFYRI